MYILIPVLTKITRWTNEPILYKQIISTNSIIHLINNYLLENSIISLSLRLNIIEFYFTFSPDATLILFILTSFRNYFSFQAV